MEPSTPSVRIHHMCVLYVHMVHLRAPSQMEK